MITLSDLVLPLAAIFLFMMVAGILSWLWMRHAHWGPWHDTPGEEGGSTGGGGPGPDGGGSTGGRGRLDPRAYLRGLNFNQLVSKYRRKGEDQPPPPTSVGPPDVPEQPIDAQISRFNVPKGSPITGRRMRDGRFRRVTGGTPGRRINESFRQAGTSPAPPPEDPIPPPDKL